MGHVDGLLDVVGDEEDAGFGLGPEGKDVVDDLAPGEGVERGEGLVEQQQLGAGDQGAGERGAHGHAAGELGGLEAGGLGQADAGEGGVGGLAGLCDRAPGEAQGQGDVGAGGEPGREGRSLEHHADLAGSGVTTDLAGGGRLETGEQAQRRGLAAAGRADEGGDFAGADLEGQGAERGAAAGVGDEGLIKRCQCGFPHPLTPANAGAQMKWHGARR